MVEGVPDGWAMGLSMVAGVTAVGLSGDAEYIVYASTDGGEAVEIHRHSSPLIVGREWPQNAGGLSADGALLCVRHAEHGDLLHMALRAFDLRTGEAVGELHDPGMDLEPVAWSPIPGDPRLAVVHERQAFERPALWNLAAGEREDVEIGLPGAVFPVCWWPDASALLLRHQSEGYDQLYRLDLATRELTLLIDPRGEITDAAVRPDGEVWLRTSNSVRPPAILTAGGRPVLAPEGEPAPEGRPYRPLWFENPAGQRIQAFLATPPGGGPFPLVMDIHGGPESHYADRFDPQVQAFVDLGFAVALVNYRGSTGYGVAFRRALKGNIGFPETEDILACLDALVAQGVADPERVVLEGWSWGGYLALLNAGLNPERWRAVIGGIPVGDYEACHYECSPPLRAWDLATLGGSPEEFPDLYRERNPMTYIDRVRAPVLVIAGEHDSRCPIGQAMRWVDALRSRGGHVQVHRYGTGHHANQIDEVIHHVELELAFMLEQIN